MTDPVVHNVPSRFKSRKAADVIPFLNTYIAKKEQEISEIEQMVERYEKRRMIEERAYQSKSTLRRLISGKKPDHHLAVEYIHYVKKPMEKVRQLRKEVEKAREILNNPSEADVVARSNELIDDTN
ncbi:hypothetical protein Back11_29530 [Paenibacillus baekrokdamisoli]|uniref:Uncharacterized protein n=1 Tax=Paenibacillus baekrokdamisoli TaxID=1712516 RepID=A0A3G9JCG0_9BACL|nr:hypothetical protein [Paenibacillus baekrokdamisoli]MBB3071189.1 hypothetical protein [Paenibacillus baekrokdamisoli]BBH21608.1 hypothetical protein Back11_29530 [Paenibacillus baekrokdamisoli]